MSEMKERGEWNRLLSVLVGLARTADRVPADEETGSLVREGLALLTGPAWERAMAAAGDVKISEAEKSAPDSRAFCSSGRARSPYPLVTPAWRWAGTATKDHS